MALNMGTISGKSQGNERKCFFLMVLRFVLFASCGQSIAFLLYSTFIRKYFFNRMEIKL